MTTKKPSKAQLAARKLFAQRSKAGTLKKPIGRVSQATGKRPSPRLKARREKSIPGYFANPAPVARKRKTNPLEPTIQKVGRKVVHFRYLVETRKTPAEKWRTVAGFALKMDAESYAVALHNLMPGMYVHVEDCE